MGSDFTNDPEAVLRGTFWDMVDAARSGRSAFNMWTGLRAGADRLAASTLAITSTVPITGEMITEAGNKLIAHVTIQDVNRYAKYVGEFLRAKQNLQTQGATDQIMGTSIWSPPWATTADNPAIPTRYEIRVQRSLLVHAFPQSHVTRWSTYRLEGPLTNVADALRQANTLFAQARYTDVVQVLNVTDYDIRTV